MSALLTPLVIVGGAAAADVLPAAAGRVLASIYNAGPGTVYIKWADAPEALTVDNGDPIMPGDRVLISTPHAVTAVAAAGSTATLRRQEVS